MLSLLIADIFSSLNDGFEYAVLRSYEDLPDNLKSQDIDLVMRRSEFIRFRESFKYILDKHQFRLLTVNIGDRFATIVVARVQSASLEALQLDFFFNFSLKGILFLNAEEVLVRRLFNGKVYHVSLVDEVLEKLLNVTLLGQQYPEKYHGKMEKVILDCTEELNSQLAKIFGDRHVNIQTLTPEQMKALRRKALKSSFRRYGLRALNQKIQYLLSTLTGLVYHNGMWICFTGPDGSGKTTVLELVSEELKKGFREVQTIHFRPDFLPRLAEVGKECGLVDEVDHDYTSPHRGEKTNIVSSFVRFTYYSLDYIWGYWSKVKKHLFNRSAIIFDRYYTDIISDSRRSRIWLSYKFIFMMRKIIPWPDFSFIIRVDPQQILKRKRELSLDQLIEIYDKLDYMADCDHRLAQIDNNRSVECAVEEVLSHILQNRDAKYQPFWI